MNEIKRVLMIKGTNDGSLCEMEVIEKSFRYYKMDVEILDLSQPELDLSENLLEAKLSSFEGGWSYVYVCAHGNGSGFGHDQVSINYEWRELSNAICTKLAPDATFLTACCRGGFHEVAYALYDLCDQIDVVAGPRFKATSGDLRAGFVAYLHQVEQRRNDPTEAIKAASAAAGIEFLFYDRLETVSSWGYQEYLTATDLESETAESEAT